MTHEERVREIRREVMCISVSVTCERICKLEELVKDMWDTHVRSKHKPTAYGWVAIQEQAEDLGIELVYE